MVQFLDNKEVKLFKKDGSAVIVKSESSPDDIAAALKVKM